MKTILTTPIPHICKKHPYNGVPYGIKVPQNQGIATENMARGPKNGIRTPFFTPYEPFLLGVSVVFDWLTASSQIDHVCARGTLRS